jgi:hypothetical protein
MKWFEWLLLVAGLLFVVVGFVSFVSAGEVTRLGSEGRCFGGDCTNLDYPLFEINNTGNHSSFVQYYLEESSYIYIPPFGSVLSASIVLRGKSFVISTLFFDSVNTSYSNTSVEHHLTYHINNVSTISSLALFLKTSANEQLSDLYVYNFTSSTYVKEGRCTSSCETDKYFYEELASWDDYINGSGDMRVNYSIQYATTSYVLDAHVNWTEGDTLGYVQNVTFFLDNNVSLSFNVTNSSDGDFNYTADSVDFTSALQTLYPDGSISQEDVLFTLNGDYYGSAEVLNFSVVYDDREMAGASEVVESAFSGAGLTEVLRSWNPEVYVLLDRALSGLFVSPSLEVLPFRLWDIFLLLIKYVFRSPASLVPEGGL